MAAAVLAMFATFASTGAQGQALYTATTRGYVSPSEIVGRLYVVDAATAGTRLIGPLRIGGGVHVGVTGLAVHPRTGVLYGITAGQSPSIRPSLIVIDPRTAEAQLVGPLGHAASDINFDSNAQLYAWLTDVNQLATVDLARGAATPVGMSHDMMGPSGGGLAIDNRGVALIATTTAVGTLDTVDLASGARTVGPVLSGAPYLSGIHSLTFSPTGTLYGVNTNLAAPAKTALVTIDRVSGVVSLVGALPEDSDGLAFSPDGATGERTLRPTYLAYAALAIALLIAAVVVVVIKQRR
jgi:DNA-binding beta-propeller fold protein YncE